MGRAPRRHEDIWRDLGSKVLRRSHLRAMGGGGFAGDPTSRARKILYIVYLICCSIERTESASPEKFAKLDVGYVHPWMKEIITVL